MFPTQTGSECTWPVNTSYFVSLVWFVFILVTEPDGVFLRSQNEEGPEFLHNHKLMVQHTNCCAYRMSPVVDLLLNVELNVFQSNMAARI